ncbi:MAG TPA: MopE-related protein, partial [Polyangium sp.]|nr:MopE-related protein [Polyangium sp.]
MKTKRTSSLISLVTFVMGVGFALTGLSGCNTEAFCWDCGASSSSSSGDAGAGGNGGAGGLFPTGGGGDGGCIFGCNNTGGGGSGGCTPTNGGIEICDKLDNDCDGTTDVGPMIDFNSIQRCGTCTNNCFTQLLNCDVASIKCIPSGNPGTDPGTCQCDMCAQDYYDLDNNETCEYYCVKSSDTDTLCNNKDDNCNGVKDEDVDLCTSTTDCGRCGRACVTIHGTSQCVNDGMMPCSEANTQCQILQCDCTAPGDCFWDLDNSYATGCEYQCDITNNGVEICDGLDNDCDGKIDAADDLSMDMNIGAVCYGDPDGECATAVHAGTTECQGGAIVCVGANLVVENQNLETCNGLDDDCDGAVDDTPTDSGRPCGASNVAPCAFGVTQCQAAQIVCVGNVDPSMEICDGVDNNCNGMIDDATQGSGVSCGQSNTPPCMMGMIQCVTGSLQCVGARNPQTETCNTIDDDCNGTVDDNISGEGAQCGQSGTAPCTFGTIQCQNGQMTCIGATNPTMETCDGIDNNCDGTVDNQAQGTGVSCGANNTFPCSFGTIQCQAGNLICIGAIDPQPETCDGQDNDCNGVIDNAPAGVGGQCGTTDTGACAYGTYQCQTGSLVCVGAINAQPEACNGVDDDCDGVIDNNATGVGAQCGQTNVGPCEYGMQQCQNGMLVCVGAINPGTETCNSIDDNCDGVVDNNTTDATGTCGTSNIYPCALGTKQCQNGSIVCVGAINPGTETCNGIDDDCDGTIDRTGGQPPTDSTGQCNVPPPPPMGATSPCRAGTKSCTGGSVQCNGSIGPTSTTDTCGVDANCDGALTNQPNLQTDVANCGSCGNNCYAGAVHSNWSCVNGMCQFTGCQSGYYDLNGDQICEYACTYISATEACNAVDDNCN